MAISLPRKRQRHRINSDFTTFCKARRRKHAFFGLFVALATIWLWLLYKVLLHSTFQNDILTKNQPDLRQIFANTKNSEWTIFYHIFVPPKNHKNALRIVQEQLDQLYQSLEQLTVNRNFFPATMYYTTIGDLPRELSAGNLVQCRKPKLQCQHLQHFKQGSETVTLHSLYEYCRVAGPDKIVTYLHSKGSFHHHKVNERWRKHLTGAALHYDCVNETSRSNNQCDVCGLYFYTQWTNFYPGNMWTAKCSYIQQLIHPKTFTIRQEEAISALLWLRYKGFLTSILFDDRLDRFGLERYSMEHWIASHPDIRPCDIATSPLKDWLKGLATEEQYTLAIGPRHRGPPVDIPPENVTDILQMNETARRMELFYLPGRLRLWDALYQKIPRHDSWIWTWFPDGLFWKDQARMGRFAGPPSGQIYETSGAASTLALASKVIVKRSHTSAFLTVDSSKTMTNSELDEFYTLLGSANDSQLIYQIVGAESEEQIHLIQTLPTSLVRHKELPTSKQRTEFGTLQHLYNYCNQRTVSPEDIVLHLTSIDTESLKMLRNCTESLQQGKCNICGGHLYRGSSVHFEVNSWMAKCGYVRQLLAPDRYVVQSNRAASNAWVEAMKNRILGVPTTPQCLEIDSYALKSWATSHPDVVPCNLPDSLRCSPACALDVGCNEVLKDDSTRLRSYFFLAGYLRRWSLIYGRLPSTSSWVWNKLPDGSLWRHAAGIHRSEDVVEVVTGPLADTSV